MFVDGVSHKFFIKKWLRHRFWEKKEIVNLESSSMSNLSRFHLNAKGDIMKLPDICPNSNYKCGKQITFTPRQFQLERGRH